MGVANFENWRKKLKKMKKKMFSLNFFFKRKTLIKGNKNQYFGAWPKMGVAKNGCGKLWKKLKNMKNFFFWNIYFLKERH
jgi:hypothetical protein